MTNERIYQDEDGQWYIRARGNARGPFPSQTEAEDALASMLRSYQPRKPKAPRTPRRSRALLQPRSWLRPSAPAN